MNIVTGLGPRTGTSFVMQSLVNAGLPVMGHKFIQDLLIPEHNPLGYYEIDPREDFIDNGNFIVKLWSHQLSCVDFSKVFKIVVLERRDKESQKQSMLKVLKDELSLPMYLNLSNSDSFSDNNISNTIDSLVDKYTSSVNELLCSHKDVLRVYTEDLNKDINKIIDFIKEF